MKIKLLAIDVDGTLLHDDHGLSERTQEAIFKIKEKGVKVVLATGRGPRSCDPLIEVLQLTDPIITHNGAVIYNPVHNTAEQQVGFKAKELLPIVSYCRSRNVHFDINTAFDMYVEQLREEFLPLYKQFFVEPVVVDDICSLTDPIVKLTLTDQPYRLDQVMKEIMPRFPDWSIIRSGETFIDVIHPQATKANALRYLLQQFRISADEVLAFGNYYNDLEMLQLAGTGVAMGNAPREVKQLADVVTRTNNEDGVAHVIENMLGDKLVV
ncbi:Cof subfamily protein (haloacid dehalogenase superfamily) [Caldalkalibacillus uzonensis]|uniref:Cof subfamily protein (Haloacid dehalogenase superfamily) n=1 Tax=Caldalkalibacillus uzonensis TaxID=353224 RepID=A0ABU0CSK8_9BACI|nr:Cof-type HAD-IIB family hydrolase [Caldalkalibacillus uzonensis]MDQ0338881.1 Cof subfamily protein (haloacid dehalogenase superfamily) [Caldalkalibacillus uzonensis]